MARKKTNRIGSVVLCFLGVWIVSICFPLNQAKSEPLDHKAILKSSDQLKNNPPKPPSVEGAPTIDKGQPALPKVTKPNTGTVPTLPKVTKPNTGTVPTLPKVTKPNTDANTNPAESY